MAQARDKPLQGRTLNPPVHAPFANTPTKAESVCGEQGGMSQSSTGCFSRNDCFLSHISVSKSYFICHTLASFHFYARRGGTTEQAQDSRGSCFWVRHTGTTNHLNKRPLYFTKYNLSVMLTFVNSVIVTINNSLRTQFCNFLRI